MINKNINTTSWVWHRMWADALIHPNEDTWNALLSEGSVSFRKAFLWLTLVAMLFPLASSIAARIKSPLSINSVVVLITIKNIVLISIFEPIGYAVLTGVVHFLAKLFSKSGNYSNLFVTFATSYAPLSVLYTLTAIVRWFLSFEIGLYAGAILTIYFTVFVLPMIVKFNYRINLFIALLICIGVAILAYYSAIVIYAITGLGI